MLVHFKRLKTHANSADFCGGNAQNSGLSANGGSPAQSRRQRRSRAMACPCCFERGRRGAHPAQKERGVNAHRDGWYALVALHFAMGKQEYPVQLSAFLQRFKRSSTKAGYRAASLWRLGWCGLADSRFGYSISTVGQAGRNGGAEGLLKLEEFKNFF